MGHPEHEEVEVVVAEKMCALFLFENVLNVTGLLRFIPPGEAELKCVLDERDVIYIYIYIVCVWC